VPKRLKILFVCGRNQWRSPTAERLYRDDIRLSVRSAGVSSKSRRKVTEDDLNWADLVLVMERRHEGRIRASFQGRQEFPPMHSLGIPDDFKFMDEELVDLVRSATEGRIRAFQAEHLPGRGDGEGTSPRVDGPRRI
jgi:predicted protein tyrosine phosphatase